MTDFILKTENQTAWFILNRPKEMNALRVWMIFWKERKAMTILDAL